MSTHAQVQIQTEQGNVDPIMLYRHHDGYPSVVIPLLRESFERGRRLGLTLDLGMQGKAAALICAVGLPYFEPCPDRRVIVHGGYLYTLTLRTPRNGKPVYWTLSVQQLNGRKSQILLSDTALVKIPEELIKRDLIVEKTPEQVAMLRVPSSTTEGTTYTVSKWSDGTYSCTCPGFGFNGKCKHLGVAQSKF